MLSDFVSFYRNFYNCEVDKKTEDWTSMRNRGELVGVVSMNPSKAIDVVQT